ncbi:MAG: sulfatase-like hydrolase/transferase, partial [Promethearchaeia archaeon]
QRHDSMGCYGQKLNVTPQLDKMAEKGVQFINAFSCQPVCGPARSIMQTGLYATETGCFRNGVALHPRFKTIAEYLSEDGYKVGYIGKWHLASDRLVFFRNKILDKRSYAKSAIPEKLRGGYKDYWLAADLLEFTSEPFEGHLFDGDMTKVEFEGYRVDKLTDFVLDFLDSQDKKQPFFLFLSYLEPHQQNSNPNSHHFVGPKNSSKKFKDFDVPGDLMDTEGNWRENYADYLGCCYSIDKNVGRIRDKLKEMELGNNTVIIYVSDHGCHFRTRNSEYKRSCHEASVHIPLIISGPGFNNRSEVNELASTINIAPTILDLAGVEIPGHFRGKSLCKLVQNGNTEWKEEIFVQISESQVGRALRTDKWKYSVKAPYRLGVFHKDSKVYIEQFLYNLEEDPHEKNNLVKDPSYEQVRKRLRKKLTKKIREVEALDVIIKPWMSRFKRLKYIFNFFK